MSESRWQLWWGGSLRAERQETIISSLVPQDRGDGVWEVACGGSLEEVACGGHRLELGIRRGAGNPLP